MIGPTQREQWAPQRSPLPTGAETIVDLVGEYPMTFTPQRSPLPTGAETCEGLHRCVRHPASTKSAPHGSGDV